MKTSLIFSPLTCRPILDKNCKNYSLITNALQACCLLDFSKSAKKHDFLCLFCLLIYNNIMEQLELFPLKNPCIGVCESNNRGYCKGCLRSRSERQQWLNMSNLQKRHVLRLCHLRHKKLLTLAIAKQQGGIVLPEQMDFGF